ncbi:hypothetical protein M1349_04805 [Patescibacteria group bacterium]|nr:hypothetical protein [Patescibacteria group bacterium]
MDHQQEQEKLLEIVQTWKLSEKPEYRGFRCANCQQYKNQAWYHWLNFKGYKLPVHMCNEDCEKAFSSGEIKIDPNKRQDVDINSFGNSYQFLPQTLGIFNDIVSSWPEYKEPQLKNFSCDLCNNNLDIDPIDQQVKGYHVWWKMPDGKILAELHFHKNCANKLGIK